MFRPGSGLNAVSWGGKGPSGPQKLRPHRNGHAAFARSASEPPFQSHLTWARLARPGSTFAYCPGGGEPLRSQATDSVS